MAMSTEAGTRAPGLFRRSAYERNAGFEAGSPLRMRLPSLSAITAAATALCALIVVYATAAQYTRHERVQGLASAGLGAMKVYAGTSGVVVQRLVSDGDSVTEGQALYQISTDRSTTQQANAVAAVTEVLRQRRLTVMNDLEVRKRLHEATVQRLEGASQSGLIQLRLLRNELTLAKKRSDGAQALLEKYRQLVISGFASEAVLLEKEQDDAAQRGQVESLMRQAESLERDIESQRQQIQEALHQTSLDLSVLKRSLSEVEQQLLDTESRRESVITAEISGRISGVMADRGQVVSPNTPLLSILPSGPVSDVQLFVPSRAIGFVRVGQPVALRFDAYPYQKFGQYPGTVRSVSMAPLARSDIQFNVSSNEDHYRVWVRLDRPWVMAYGKRMDLQNGMQVEADILLDRRRLYEWLLEPLLGFVERT